MVDVCVRQQHAVNLRGGDGQLLIFVYVGALFHAAIHEDVQSRSGQHMTAAGHLPVGTQKSQFHFIFTS